MASRPEGVALPPTLTARSQVDLILARVIISAITFVAAIALAALCLYRRAVTVPLQWILVFAFLARTCRQLLLMGPMIAAAQDEVLPRSLSAPVDVVDTWEVILHGTPLLQPHLEPYPSLALMRIPSTPTPPFPQPQSQPSSSPQPENALQP